MIKDLKKIAKDLIKDLDILNITFDPGLDGNGCSTGNITIVITGRYNNAIYKT